MIAGVLCTGNIVMDVLTRAVDEITWGGTKWVDSIALSLGGNGANTSAALGKLGVPVRLIGAVGDDVFGTAALQRLAECGVDTRMVRTLDAGTATTVALVRSDGTRAFLHRPGVSRQMFSESFLLSAECVSGCTRFHLGNPFSMTHLRAKGPQMLREAKQLGLATSLDTAWDALGEWMTVLRPSLPFVDLLFVNEDEARQLVGTAEAAEVVRRLRDEGARTVVLKLGSKGCIVFGGMERLDVPAYAVDVVDTTGAGDCFAGAWLAALQRGCGQEQAARVANAVGALNVQSLGATSGLRSWEETCEWMECHSLMRSTVE